MTKNKKNILVTGGNGFIGSNFLQFEKKTKGKNQHKIIAPNHKRLDIYNMEQLKRIFNTYVPDVVINFAAHRNANSAELQRGDFNGSAWRTNVIGVENILKLCKEFNTFLIHISTDMVFSGSKSSPGPYDEEAEIERKSENLSWYGWTKAEAERVLAKKKNTAVIRIGNVTQPIYDPKLDYVGKILYLFDNKKLYPLFHDQYLTLTYVFSLFEVINSLITSQKKGIFHVASQNLFTPYALSKYLIKKTRGREKMIKRISIEKFLKQAPNRYPKYGGLLALKTQKKLKIPFHDWEEIVDIYIRTLEAS